MHLIKLMFKSVKAICYIVCLVRAKLTYSIDIKSYHVNRIYATYNDQIMFVFTEFNACFYIVLSKTFLKNLICKHFIFCKFLGSGTLN